MSSYFTSFSPDPRADLFKFAFPENFWKPEITDKYDKFLALHDQVIDNISGIVNESVVDFNLPTFGYTPISQEQLRNGYSTSEQYSSPNDNIQKVIDKNFTLSFRHSTAYITYFCLLEHFMYFYENSTKEHNLGTFSIQTTTDSELVVNTINFNSVLMLGMSGLPLSYAAENSIFSTFDLTFQYSTFNTLFDLPEPTGKFKS